MMVESSAAWAVPAERLREDPEIHGYSAHRQDASDGLHPAGERPPPGGGEPTDAAVAWSHAPAGDEGPGSGRHGGPDEEHHAGTLPAGAPGGRGDRLRLRLRRDGPVPRRRLQAAREYRAGAAADP